MDRLRFGSLLLLFVFLAGLSGSSSAQEMNLVTEQYDMSEFFVYSDFQKVKRVINELSFGDDGGFDMSCDSDSEFEEIEEDDRKTLIVNMLKSVAGIENLNERQDGKFVSITWGPRNRLAVTTDGEIHLLLKEFFTYLKKITIRSPVAVQLDYWSIAQEYLCEHYQDLHETGKLLKQARQADKALLLYSGSISSPVPEMSMSSMQNRQYLEDYDVQVTQGVFVMDPIIGDWEFGVYSDLVAVPYTGENDKIFLSGNVYFSDLLSNRTFVLNDSGEQLELPRAAISNTSVRKLVNNKQDELLFMGDLPGVEGQSLLITGKCSMAKESWQTADIRELANGDSVLAFDGFQISRFLGVDDSLSDILDYIYEKLDSSGFDTEKVFSTWFNKYLIVISSKRTVKEVYSLLEMYLQAKAETSWMDCIMLQANNEDEITAMQALGEGIAGGGNMTKLLKRSGLSFQLISQALEAGKPSSLVSGVEAYYVEDYDVQVATDAYIYDPVIGNAVVDGGMFNLCWEGKIGNSHRISLDIIKENSSNKRQEIKSQGRKIYFEIYSHRETMLQGQYALEIGKWVYIQGPVIKAAGDKDKGSLGVLLRLSN